MAKRMILTGIDPDIARARARGESGVQFRLLICDMCRACWPTERSEADGGSRLDNEPCAYRWPDGRVCAGTVHPVGHIPPWERDWEPERPGKPERFRVYSGSWCEVLGVPWGCQDLALVRRRYRELAKKAHPDQGGSHEGMKALNEAYRLALSELAPKT